MKNLIGEKLQTALNYLEQNGFNYIIKDNNFSVDGDTKLVTNIKIENNVAIVTTGNFVIDVKNKTNK